MKRFFLLLIIALGAFCACTIMPLPDPDPTPGPDPDPTPGPDPIEYSAADGVQYMFDGATVPKVHIHFSLSEWNKLLGYYDANHDTKEQVVCDVTYDKAGEVTKIDNCGIRLRGNTSRRRPEGTDGQMHVAGETDWHHCHFQVNFRKYIKDDAHELHGARKVYLKWFKDDPCYVREVFCYDLFQRYGVWMSPHSAYCQLYIMVEGDPKETYFGVYEMVEPVDDRFLKVRKDELASATKGFLWKCRWGAKLNSTNGNFGPDDDSGAEYTYELKTETKDFAAAETQLKDFIAKLNGKGDESFKTWIPTVCDVSLLLRTYAVNVAVGMWDDYWNDQNNYYLYFDSKDRLEYKFYFIPFDYDNTLGTTHNCGVQNDAGRHNPLQWGDNSNPLIYRILKIDEYKALYKSYLLELVGADKGLMYYEQSVARVKAWQSQIEGMTANDTGEDMVIEDRPAPWGSHGEYRLMDVSSVNNFFKVKAQSINTYCR